jgi:hypothetical protein
VAATRRATLGIGSSSSLRAASFSTSTSNSSFSGPTIQRRQMSTGWGGSLFDLFHPKEPAARAMPKVAEAPKKVEAPPKPKPLVKPKREDYGSDREHEDAMLKYIKKGMAGQPGYFEHRTGVHWTDQYSPEVALKTGIPHRGDNFDAEDHLDGVKGDSAYRGTSNTRAGYELVTGGMSGTAYGYEIDHPVGMKDFSQALGHRHREESETTVPSMVLPHMIKSVTTRGEDGILTREANPAYDPKRIAEERAMLAKE